MLGTANHKTQYNRYLLNYVPENFVVCVRISSFPPVAEDFVTTVL
jgi:hypothetical protein